jgi:hypothetical protein
MIVETVCWTKLSAFFFNWTSAGSSLTVLYGHGASGKPQTAS